MTALSNYAETTLLTWLCTASAATRPNQWHLQVHTGDPGETGANGLTGLAGQARAAITWAAVSGNSISNSAATNVAMTVTPGSNLTHVSIWDAATGGNCLAYGALAQPRTVASGDTFSVPAGQLTLSLD
jgi:hypothetical protein